MYNPISILKRIHCDDFMMDLFAFQLKHWDIDMFFCTKLNATKID